MTFSVLICSTRSFKDVFPSSELKKKKDQKFFPFLSFFLIFVSFLFFSLRKTLICTAVCVCFTVFFFFSFAQFTRVRFLRRSISHIFFFFFFFFSTQFSKRIFASIRHPRSKYIYIFERETTSLGLDMRRNYTFRFL